MTDDVDGGAVKVAAAAAVGQDVAAGQDMAAGQDVEAGTVAEGVDTVAGQGVAADPDSPVAGAVSTGDDGEAFTADDFPGGVRACLEAILMASDQPLTPRDLSRVLGVGVAETLTALRSLRDEYDGRSSAEGTGGGSRRGPVRGFELRETARGWQFGSRKLFAPVVSRFVRDGQVARLSQAALEALAIVAYKQPVTRAQVTAIRGVSSDGVIRSLTMRGLIREVGVDDDTRAALLGTTTLFLEMMGLDSLDGLPSLTPFLPASVAEVREETS